MCWLRRSPRRNRSKRRAWDVVPLPSPRHTTEFSQLATGTAQVGERIVQLTRNLGGAIVADAGDEGDPPAEREIADGERSQIDHRPGEGKAAHDEAKPRDTGDPGASGDCRGTVQSQRDRANPHLPFDPTEGPRVRDDQERS